MLPIGNVWRYGLCMSNTPTVSSLTVSEILGYKRAASALDRSRYATTSPRILTLPDGTFVGVGDTHADGDAMLFGARGTSAWRSEVSL